MNTWVVTAGSGHKVLASVTSHKALTAVAKLLDLKSLPQYEVILLEKGCFIEKHFVQGEVVVRII